MRLSHLRLYPLKSGAGEPVRTARLEPRGLAGDRRWLVVDSAGTAITQRDVPGLALVRARPVDGGLRIAAPGAPELEVSVNGSTRREVRVWGQAIDAADAGERAAAWFRTALGHEAHLVHMDDRSTRSVAPHGEGPSYEVSFADELPLLVVGTASLAELERRLVERGVPLVPLAMERFRPNLVVETEEPFAEDRWARIAVGETTIDLVKPCSRCSMITVDQATGEVAAHGEPLRTLARFRAVTGGDYPHEAKCAYFGWRGVASEGGVLRVGDGVRVLERRDARRG